MKLRTKVIVFSSVIIALIVTLTVLYLQTSVKESFSKQITDNVRVMAEEKEGTYFAFIETLKTLTLNWSSDNYIKELVEKAVDEKRSPESRNEAATMLGVYLREKKMKYNPEVVLVDILDKDGIVVSSSDEGHRGIDEYKEEKELQAHHFSKTINAGFGEVFSRSIIFEEDEHTEPMFHLTTRLFSSKLNAQGEFVPLPAVILVHFASLSRLSGFLEGDLEASRSSALTSDGFVKSFETSDIYLVNAEGIVVTPTRSIKNIVEKNYINTKPVQECFENMKEVKGSYLNYRGVPVVGASMCMLKDGLVLIAEIETREAYALYDTLLISALYSGGGVLLAVILLVFLVSHRILNRFSLIVETAKKVANGDFTSRVPPAGDDEIGYLARIFNTMLDAIEKSREKLERSEEDLREKAELLKLDVKKHEEQEKFLEESKRAQLNLLEDMLQAKEKIEVEDYRLQTILSSISDGLILVDGQCAIALVNPKAQGFLGMAHKDLLGKDLRSIIKLQKKKRGESTPTEWSTEEMFLPKKVVSTGLEEGLSLTTEKNTTPLPVALSVAPLGGGLAGSVIILHDATEDRALDEAKSGFISVASHQLRTPLTTIRWYAEMLLSGDAGALSSSQKDFLDEIHGGAERLYQTIDLLLGISRVESGRVKAEKAPIELAVFTEDLIKELAPSITQRKLAVSVVPPADRSLVVSLDPLMLRQVVVNLLSNAIRYTNESGSVEVCFERKGDDVVYSVRDNGIGIPLSQQGRIFTKFFRAENALVKAPDGSGLGLALVRELVESWKGKVWFETQEGKGTTFYFTIPRE